MSTHDYAVWRAANEARKTLPTRLRENADLHGALTPLLREAADAIDHLQRTIDQQRRDAIEAEREFGREARDIAAEAAWQARQGEDFGSY
jgi:hypothetical protein